MLARVRTSRLVVAVVAFYAVSAVLVSFAHRAPAAAAPSVGDLAAYVLVDGGAPDLCLTGAAGGAGGDASVTCEACLLTSAPGLGPVQAAGIVPPLASVTLAVDAAAPVRRALSIFRPASRGPPAFPVSAA